VAARIPSCQAHRTLGCAAAGGTPETGQGRISGPVVNRRRAAPARRPAGVSDGRPERKRQATSYWPRTARSRASTSVVWDRRPLLG
jgi:hypothetical protein